MIASLLEYSVFIISDYIYYISDRKIYRYLSSKVHLSERRLSLRASL